MTDLALYILSLILLSFTPGNTKRSVVIVEKGSPGAFYDDCYYGMVREKMVDGKPKRLCKPARKDAGAWVRIETREEGARRLELAASAEGDAVAAVAGAWPEGERDLGRFVTSTWGWSGGYQKGMQEGNLRGPAFEGCVADLHPKTLRQFAPKELQGLTDAELFDRVTGDTYAELRLCMDIGLQAILNARTQAERRCKGRGPIELTTFAMYATGRYCTMPPPLDWADDARVRTLAKFRARKTTVFPDWYQPERDATHRLLGAAN